MGRMDPCALVITISPSRKTGVGRGCRRRRALPQLLAVFNHSADVLPSVDDDLKAVRATAGYGATAGVLNVGASSRGVRQVLARGDVGAARNEFFWTSLDDHGAIVNDGRAGESHCASGTRKNPESRTPKSFFQSSLPFSRK